MINTSHTHLWYVWLVGMRVGMEFIPYIFYICLCCRLGMEWNLLQKEYVSIFRHTTEIGSCSIHTRLCFVILLCFYFHGYLWKIIWQFFKNKKEIFSKLAIPFFPGWRVYKNYYPYQGISITLTTNFQLFW